MSVDKIPCRVTVGSIVRSRYEKQTRPADWAARVDGIDVITTTDGEELRLYSNGQQNTPQPNWVLLLTGGSAEEGYEWTLYGMPGSVKSSRTQPAQ